MSARLPYPGLRAYTRDETDLFFGREGCVNEMVNGLAAERFLAVLGASGSGKSSLVRTGLLDALELGLHAAAGPFWAIADLHPGGSPVRNLAGALLTAAGTVPGIADIDTLDSFLRRGPRGIVEWVQDGHLPSGQNLLVLVDQFEELFRYGDYASREEAEAFVALLLEAAAADIGIHIVITMRSEYLGACALIPGLAEQINRSLYLTRRMTRQECREAIEGPAAVLGFDIEPRLVTRLLNDLTSFAPWDADLQTSQLQRLSRQADQLPLMQHVLSRLWQLASQRGGQTRPVLTLDDYLAIGQIEGAVDRHGRAVMEDLAEPARALVPRVFRALVAGTSLSDAVRRPLRFSDLIAIVGAERELVADVVNAFRAHDCNFLRPPEDQPLDDAAIVDISHESLIRQWRSLADWFAEEARSAALWNRLVVAEGLYRAREGELLKGLDLANALAWWKRETPTPAWADSHGDHFGAVESYLRVSSEAEDAQRRIAADRDAAEKQALRRRNNVYAGLLAVCILGFGIAIVFFRMLTDTNDALARTKTELESNYASLVTMTTAAQEARGRAESALQGEEMANASALDAAETFVVDFAKRLSFTPGVSRDFIDLRLKEGRDFIEKLDARMRDERRLVLTRAKFALAAGGVLLDRGDYDNALATFAEGETLLVARPVAELSPNEVMTLAELRRGAANSLHASGHYKAAEERAGAAIDLLTQRADLDDGEAILALARAEYARGSAQGRDSRHTEAVAGAKRCVDLMQRQGVDDGTDRARVTMQCHRLLTASIWYADPAESRKHAYLAQEAFERIPPSEWTIPIANEGAEIIGNIGFYHAADKEYDKARALYVKGENLLRGFLSDAGVRTNPVVRSQLVWLQNKIGQAFRDEDNYKDASIAFEKAVEYGVVDDEWRKMPVLADDIDTAAENLVLALAELEWRTDPELLTRREQALRRLLVVREHLIVSGRAPWCHSCLLNDRVTLFEILNRYAPVRGVDRTSEVMKIADGIIDEAKAVLEKPQTDLDAVNARRAWFWVVNQLLEPHKNLPPKAALDLRLERLEAARKRLTEFTRRLPQSWRAEQTLGRAHTALAKVYLEAGRTDQAVAAAEEGAASFDRDAVALLAEWYRTGSGPAPQNAEKARQYEARLVGRNWQTPRYNAKSVTYRWNDTADPGSYEFDVVEPRSADDDAVARIVLQLEEIEGIRLTDSLKSDLTAYQTEAKERGLSFIDVLAYKITGTRSVTDDDVAAGVKDRLAFADVDGAACRLIGWWKDESNRTMVRDGLAKLIKDGLSNNDLRRASAAAQFAPHALDPECTNTNTTRTEETEGKDLLAQVVVVLDQENWRDIAAAVSRILLADIWLNPATRAGMLYMQARVFEREGEVEKFETALAQALALRPDNANYMNLLGYSWVERNVQLPSAIALLERAAALAPNDSNIRDSLGWGYVTAGDAAKGLPLLETAAAADPDHAEIAAHVADTLRRLGRIEEARAAFELAAGKPKSDEKIRTFIGRQMLLVEREDDIKAAAALLKQADAQARVGISTDDMGIAIRGYDPVSYHVSGQPQLGSVRYAAIWQGALWLFTSAENRTRFTAEPERFAPAFGGFCAYCVASGNKQHADPTAWIIVADKLYLHLSQSYRESWRKEPDRYLNEALKRWPALQSTAAAPDKTLAVSERLVAVTR